MPYVLADARGYLTDGPTIAGWRALRVTATGPETRAFIETGICENPLTLAHELTNHRGNAAASRLRAAALSADTLLVLSTGKAR